MWIRKIFFYDDYDYDRDFHRVDKAELMKYANLDKNYLDLKIKSCDPDTPEEERKQAHRKLVLGAAKMGGLCGMTIGGGSAGYITSSFKNGIVGGAVGGIAGAGMAGLAQADENKWEEKMNKQNEVTRKYQKRRADLLRYLKGDMTEKEFHKKHKYDILDE